MKDIVYNNYIQAIFNYPMEWMNLLCCCFITPKECIKEFNIYYLIIILLLPIFLALYIAIFLAAIAIGLVSGLLLGIFYLICLPCSCETC